MNTDADKRQHPRIPVETEYRLFIGGQYYVGKTSNISANGAFLVVPPPGLPQSCISQFGDLDVFLHDQWQHFRCQIVFVGADQDTLSSGAGVENIFARHLD